MAAIINAVGRGFTSNRIIHRLAQNYPQYANGILAAQAAGYTGTQILRSIYKKKTGKDLPEESFMTEFEKTRNQDDKRKRNRALTTLGVLTAAGAGVAGARYLAARGAAIQPTQVLPALPAGRIQQVAQAGQTINVGPRQIGNNQRALPYHPPMVTPTRQGLPGPQAPSMTQGHQGPAPQAPSQPPAVRPATGLLKDALKNQRNPLESIQAVANLKQDGRFKTLISQGHDVETTSELLKLVMPKEAVKALESRPGGLETVVEDYKKHLEQSPQVQNPIEQVAQAPQQLEPISKPEMPKTMPFEQTAQEMTTQTLPQEQTQLTQQTAPSIEQNQPEKRLAIIPKGQVGEIVSVKNGVAEINVNGKIHKEKESAIHQEPPDVETAVRTVVNSVPEGMKSTNLESLVHIPGVNVLLSKFWDGKWAWYLDFPEDTYENIAMGLYKPKGTGETGIAKYNPGIMDSRGAGFSKEVVQNPKYSKKNKGITWGYASNKYDALSKIQPLLHKISKEKIYEGAE